MDKIIVDRMSRTLTIVDFDYAKINIHEEDFENIKSWLRDETNHAVQINLDELDHGFIIVLTNVTMTDDGLTNICVASIKELLLNHQLFGKPHQS